MGDSRMIEGSFVVLDGGYVALREFWVGFSMVSWMAQSCSVILGDSVVQSDS